MNAFSTEKQIYKTPLYTCTVSATKCYHLKVECQHPYNKRKIFAKPHSHASVLPLFSEVGCSGIPAMLLCFAKIQKFPMNFIPQHFIKKELSCVPNRILTTT